MDKDMDNKLATFTDQMLDEIVPDDLPWAAEGDEMRAIQKLVVSLRQLGGSESRMEVKSRILSRLKNQWEAPSPDSSASWQSSRKRRNSISLAIGFAVIVVVIVIYPFTPVGDSGLPGAAEGGNLAPAILILIGLVTAAFFMFRRKGNGKG